VENNETSEKYKTNIILSLAKVNEDWMKEMSYHLQKQTKVDKIEIIFKIIESNYSKSSDNKLKAN